MWINQGLVGLPGVSVMVRVASSVSHCNNRSRSLTYLRQSELQFLGSTYFCRIKDCSEFLVRGGGPFAREGTRF